MKIEYEAKFLNIDKGEMRKCLNQAGAILVREEFLQRRTVFNLLKENHNQQAWVRVRDEGDKITLSLKVIDGNEIHNQKEEQIVVNDFETTCQVLKGIGCIEKAYQETKRELWILDGVEIAIDEWPFLEPFVEVEGESEEKVKEVSQKLGFDYSKAIFGEAGRLLSMKYGIPIEVINNYPGFAKLVFGGENPYLKYLEGK